MYLPVRNVLNPAQLLHFRELLDRAPWADGRVTAGVQSAHPKNNEQLPQDCELAKVLQTEVLSALNRHPTLFSAALPKRVFPPLFNRYAGNANAFGNHVDNAIRYLPGGQGRVRTDLSCTLFLSDPETYEGGALVLECVHGPVPIKLAAGDLVLYPSTVVHRVEPVTRGTRLASFFWIESLVRSPEQRQLLYEMDQQLMALRIELGETHPAIIGLTGTYHNLLRQWADS